MLSLGTSTRYAPSNRAAAPPGTASSAARVRRIALAGSSAVAACVCSARRFACARGACTRVGAGRRRPARRQRRGMLDDLWSEFAEASAVLLVERRCRRCCFNTGAQSRVGKRAMPCSGRGVHSGHGGRLRLHPLAARGRVAVARLRSACLRVLLRACCVQPRPGARRWPAECSRW